MQATFRNFAVFLMGHNFPLDVEGAIALQGFFITVRVERPDEASAATAAVDRVRSMEVVASAQAHDSGPPPTIEVRAVHELPMSNKMKDTGLVLFSMSEDEGEP